MTCKSYIYTHFSIPFLRKDQCDPQKTSTPPLRYIWDFYRSSNKIGQAEINSTYTTNNRLNYDACLIWIQHRKYSDDVCVGQKFACVFWSSRTVNFHFTSYSGLSYYARWYIKECWLVYGNKTDYWGTSDVITVLDFLQDQ